MPEETKPQEAAESAESAESVPQVIGLKGEPIAQPHGRWLAAVDDQGNLVKQDGLLVRVKDDLA